MSALLSTRSATPVWSLADAAPKLYRSIPAAALVDAASIPVAAQVSPFAEGVFERPYRHLRAFYRRLDCGGVLAVKGTEIYAADAPATLAAMRSLRVDYPSRGRSLFSYLDHFPMVEQKIPLAVPLAEAIEDCEASMALQAAHLDRFGAIARAPLPLLAARWPDADAEAFVAMLSPLLQPRARAIVETVAAGGLGVMLYAYPTLPLRVAHLDQGLGLAGCAGYAARKAKLAAHADLEAALDGWLELAARMLALGFLPGSIESIGIGHCLEAQNAVLDGGFVDLGSMKHLSEAADAWEVRQSLQACLSDLAKTVRVFLLGGMADCEAEYRNPSPAMSLLTTAVWDGLKARLERMRGEGGIPPEVAAWISAPTAFAAVDAGLNLLFPSDTTGSDHA